MLQTCKSTPPVQTCHGYLPEPDFQCIGMFLKGKSITMIMTFCPLAPGMALLI